MTAIKKNLLVFLDRFFSSQLDRVIEFYSSEELKFDEYGNPVCVEDINEQK